MMICLQIQNTILYSSSNRTECNYVTHGNFDNAIGLKLVFLSHWRSSVTNDNFLRAYLRFTTMRYLSKTLQDNIESWPGPTSKSKQEKATPWPRLSSSLSITSLTFPYWLLPGFRHPRPLGGVGRRCWMQPIPKGAEGSSLGVNDQLATNKSNANGFKKIWWRLFLTPVVMPESLHMERQRK